jgi:malonyl-CoA O-methyltransferase
MKLKIKNNFDKSSKTYDKVANVQKEAAKVLTKLLVTKFPDFYPSSILDLGTGTGFATEELLLHFANSQYLLNDISDKMLEVAKSKLQHHQNISFTQGDIEEEDFADHDLIVANFVLQLIDNFKKTIKKLSAKSKIIAFNVMLDGSFKEWSDLYQNDNLISPIANYPDPKEVQKYCLSLKPKDYLFLVKDFDLEFESAFCLAKYFNNLGSVIGATKYDPIILKKFLNQHNFAIKTKYRVLFVILKMT